MADTPSTGTTPDQATPTDIITAQSTGETVQLAAAAAAVEVSAPARGADASLTVEPGQTVELKDPVVRFTQDGANLVIHWSNTAHTTVVDALAAGTPVILADGTPLTFEQLLAQIPNVDPSAFAPAAVAPAAGAAALAAAGGAFNTEYDGGTLGPEHGILGLLGDTTLEFRLLEFFEELPGLIAGVEVPEEFDPCNPADLRALFLSTWNHSPVDPPILGDDSVNDILNGTSGDDDIFGFGGNDRLEGRAGNDSIVGGDGRDTLVGDFFTTDGISIDVTNDGESDQTFDNYDDLLEGGDGNDVLVGDIFLKSDTDDDITISVSNYNGDNNVFDVFNDFLDGGDGNNTLVGDVFWLGNKTSDSNSFSLEVINTGGGQGSADGNVFNAFNDMLVVDGDGRNVMVGDLYFDNDDESFEGTLSIELTVSNYHGNNNTFHVFNDFLIGGDGDDTMVGDVMVVIGSTGGTQSSSLNIDLEVSNNSGDNNVFNAFNDHLCGLDGDDLMVGDVFVTGRDISSEGSNLEIELQVSNNSGNDNTFHAFNDILLGFEGEDTLVGDVYILDYDNAATSNEITLEVSNSNGDNNTFFAFNDILDSGGFDGGEGGPGSETLVGDVLFDATSVSQDIDLRVSNFRGDNNTFFAFNDVLTAGDGNDMLVGDVFFTNPDGDGEDVDLRVGNFGSYGEGGGNNNKFKAFDDTLTGGEGNDTMVGDVFIEHGHASSETYELSVSNFYGNDNTFDAFNDVLDGGDGNNLLVGDVLVGTRTEQGTTALRVANFGASGAYGEGDGNVFHAFNDDMTAGGGNDTMIGDVWIDRPNSEGGSRLVFRLDVSNSNADNNTFHAFNDTLDAGDGNNMLVGDVLYVKDQGDSTEEASLAVSNNSGNDNVFSAFNDSLAAGNGNDIMIGDVWLDINTTESRIDLDMMVSNFRGDNNTFDAFNDTLNGGGGNNTLVGDLYLEVLDGLEANSTSDISLTVRNSSGGDNNTFRAFNDSLMVAGAGANLLVGDVFLDLVDASTVEIDLQVLNNTSFENQFSAFNDTLSGAGGQDILVGDVFSGTENCTAVCADPEDVDLRVSNFNGDLNTFQVFNDSLTGGGGNDLLVGDVAFDDPDDVTANEDLDLDVFNIEGGEGNADNNVFDAFNDTLAGGDGIDILVGDVGIQGGPTMSIDIDVSNLGGDNNTFDAFNDDLSGGAGDDLLVGDVGLLNNFSDIDINVSDTGGTGNVFTLFSDTLDGDGGDDVIFGDFASGNLAGPLTNFTPAGLSISLTGMDGGDTLFSDTIDGGTGDDQIWGQLGDDLLTGGSGADVFHFDGSVNIMDDMDTITDYSIAAGDMVDLDVLFDVLATGNAAARATDITISAGVGSVLTIGSHSDFSITFTGVDLGGTGTAGEFSVAQLAALGIDVGF